MLSTEKLFQVHKLAVNKQDEEENRNKKHEDSLEKSQQSSHGYNNKENIKIEQSERDSRDQER